MNTKIVESKIVGSKIVELSFVKSTKGTHVYGSDLEDAATPSVYVKRSALPEKPPAKITLTLSWQ